MDEVEHFGSLALNGNDKHLHHILDIIIYDSIKLPPES